LALALALAPPLALALALELASALAAFGGWLSGWAPAFLAGLRITRNGTSTVSVAPLAAAVGLHWRPGERSSRWLPSQGFVDWRYCDWQFRDWQFRYGWYPRLHIPGGGPAPRP
jgi:hypothetical protein